MKAAVALAVALVLTLPSAASAKGPSVVVVCGPRGCLGTAAREATAELSRVAHGESSVSFAASPPLGPYYELRGERPFSVTYGYFVPGSRAISVIYPPHTGAPWRETSAAFTRAVGRLAARLKPFPAPKPYRFSVERTALPRPVSYLGLLGPLARAQRPLSSTHFVWLTFGWEQPNPWSGDQPLRYVPHERALYRGGRWFRVPGAIARRLNAAAVR